MSPDLFHFSTGQSHISKVSQLLMEWCLVDIFGLSHHQIMMAEAEYIYQDKRYYGLKNTLISCWTKIIHYEQYLYLLR